jgi:hypothetical protein
VTENFEEDIRRMSWFQAIYSTFNQSFDLFYEVLRPVETILRMGGGRIKENDKESEFNYDIL